MPSDAEDMFFLTPTEVADVHREKRRRLLDRTREERLQARLEEDGRHPSAPRYGRMGRERRGGTQRALNYTPAYLLNACTLLA